MEKEEAKKLAQAMSSLRVVSTHACALSSCGCEFEGISTKIYCSNKCKQKDYRKRRDNA